ncbi:hypothetical protein BDB00DRAFT_805134 [Zychaea mexicana]|uniref:uncharacterized protein n=1 Tax=Zychaea mexicana TaxID=64656 RepID=UPI0022FF00BD|nr:uncharacterized protein BDB00DRAFT_805134 [Zychaea mexicana]KAI9497140.1 hypothetical protein BDB00DRAFT_805134 [Zychaea mexicana]
MQQKKMAVSTPTYPSSIHDSPTLLPENLASFVTAASLAARLSLRCSSVFAEALFEAAKYGTVLSLGISRQALTNALATAKRLHTLTYPNSCDESISDADRNGFLRILDKYTNLGIYIVHNTFTLAELFALSGLQLTSQTVKSGFKTAEESVRIIDGIFGSNETSRAIASIITLVHKELMLDPEFELAQTGKVTMLAGLTKAMTAFAVLQYVTHKRMMKQTKFTVLWEGLVLEEGDSNSDDNDDDPSAARHGERNNQHALVHSVRPSKDVIRELEQVLVQSMDDTMYEITTTTQRTMTTTTRIQPVAKEPTDAKYVVVRSDEESQQAFMAAVDRSNAAPVNSRERQLVLATPRRSDSGYAEEDDQPIKESEQHPRQRQQQPVNVVVSALSQKMTRKSMDRQEKFGEKERNLIAGSIIAAAADERPVKRRNSVFHKGTQMLALQAQKCADANSNRKRIIRQRRSSTGNVITIPSLSPICNNNNNEASPPTSRIYRSHSISSSTTFATFTASSSPPPSASKNDVNNNTSPKALPNTTTNITTHINLLTTTTGPQFPHHHLVSNIARFMRYASAAYGETFMRILGIGKIPSAVPSAHHSNHHSFVHHTGLALEDILLSSYTDRSFLTMHHPSIHELVHYVTADHAAQAIVLTCRGTLGLSDVLTDLTCGYSEVDLPGIDSNNFKAHGGMLEAAQMLAKEKGKVFRAILEGLERYPDYGLVLCGHSLGGGVAALVSLLWSEKDKQGNFVLSPTSGLGSGRPIHCYVYGPPCVMSLELSLYCCGLVTSVVHRYDIVSSLSLGLLKDFKNVAVSLHTEAEVADQILSKVINRYRTSTVDDSEDDWFWALIKTMRADMRAEKLYPPSTVYTIELIPSRHKQYRAVLSRCDDIQARFSEILFSRTMFMDHSPTNYERVIRQLCKGFFGQDGAYEHL